MKTIRLNKAFAYFLAAFLLVGTITSCSSDDNGIPSVIEQTSKIKTETKKEFTIDPKIATEGTQFFWFDGNNELSTESTLTHSYAEPGKYVITLKTINNDVKSFYRYDIEVVKSATYNYVTLDLTNFNLNDGITSLDGKYWKDTYVDGTYVQSQIFKFSHTAIPEWNTWDGFTVSNVQDNSDQGEGNSGGWIENQWGNMAQGGLKGKGSPYLVGFWGYYGKDYEAEEGVFDEKMYSNWIKIDDNKNEYKAVNLNMAIHPWPYYGILNGDSFARKFTQGDFFKINIYGVDDTNKISTEVVEHYFVDFRNGVNEISLNWQQVDLSSLGKVKYLLFQLDTSDSGAYGPNTAVYFCMDGLTVERIEKNKK